MKQWLLLYCVHELLGAFQASEPPVPDDDNPSTQLSRFLQFLYHRLTLAWTQPPSLSAIACEYIYSRAPFMWPQKFQRRGPQLSGPKTRSVCKSISTKFAKCMHPWRAHCAGLSSVPRRPRRCVVTRDGLEPTRTRSPLFPPRGSYSSAASNLTFRFTFIHLLYYSSRSPLSLSLSLSEAHYRDHKALFQRILRRTSKAFPRARCDAFAC